MSSRALSDQLLLLVGFLLTSAHGLVNEPETYGPVRLLDAAGRVLAMMDEQGMLDDSLRDIRAEIDHERFGPLDEEGLSVKLDQLALRWTELIRG